MQERNPHPDPGSHPEADAKANPKANPEADRDAKADRKAVCNSNSNFITFYCRRGQSLAITNALCRSKSCSDSNDTVDGTECDANA